MPLKSLRGLNAISGYRVDDQSDIVETDTVNTSTSNTSIFSNMEEAKAAIALAMLSQLLKRFNNEWTPNWDDDSAKYSIFNARRNYQVRKYTKKSMSKPYLVFQTHESAEEFLKLHNSLIIKAQPFI